MNLGFGDVALLTKILAEAIISGSLLNNMIYLRQYETQRQRHNTPTMLTIDALHRLYRGTAAPIVLARSLGLQLVNAVPQFKVTTRRDGTVIHFLRLLVSRHETPVDNYSYRYVTVILRLLTVKRKG